MKKYLFVALILAACSSAPPKKVEPIGVAADRGGGDLESGTYNSAEGENLLVVTKSLRSRIEEVEAHNRDLDAEIQEQKLRQKALTAEGNELSAKSAQMAAQVRDLASQPKAKVHRTTTVTEESDQ